VNQGNGGLRAVFGVDLGGDAIRCRTIDSGHRKPDATFRNRMRHGGANSTTATGHQCHL
jgi:hypothetical protein